MKELKHWMNRWRLILRWLDCVWEEVMMRYEMKKNEERDDGWMSRLQRQWNDSDYVGYVDCEQYVYMLNIVQHVTNYVGEIFTWTYLLFFVILFCCLLKVAWKRPLNEKKNPFFWKTSSAFVDSLTCFIQ